MSKIDLQETPYSNAVYTGPQLNSQNNIISGPGPGQYWNHSPGLEKPILREEGPFPIQGNIGSLLKQEGSNYSNCSNGPPISGSPNCTGAFVADMFTQRDACGDNCTLTYPQSFGGKSFGLVDNKVTNSHGLHAYKNVRAGTEGKGPSDVYGCYEWEPRLTKTTGNSCTLNQYPEYQQVGAWTDLPQAKSIVDYTYKP